ncbi:AraC family transcriptional regulator [Bacillus sp. NPDC077027]|uniref:AraC family transcriptional regulator n=1 Tax=Bacillus sp. NPDC077027 TaxID=3390548 RepID=UPI003D0487BC
MEEFKQLEELTEEERMILEKHQPIHKSTYTNLTDFVIQSEKFLSENEMIVIRKHTRFVHFPRHKHNYIEINYVLKGELKQHVGHQRIHLKKGELLFLNQQIEHEIEACQKEDIILNFIIQPQFFTFIFSFLTTENPMRNFLINSLYETTKNGQYIYFQVADIPEIQALVKRIILDMLKPSFMSNEIVKLHMGLLVIELVKHADKTGHLKQETSDHYVIVETLKYIDTHFKNGTLNELSQYLHLPHYLLSKKIKKSTGYTFKALLQEKRLAKAKELLEETELSIVNIAAFIGYENISHFYRIFKQTFGKTPKQLRIQGHRCT